MAKIKGQREYDKFIRGEKLSFKEALYAFCYSCNGEEEGGIDCGCCPKPRVPSSPHEEESSGCPIYQHMPYNKNRTKKRVFRVMSDSDKKKFAERMKLSRKKETKCVK